MNIILNKKKMVLLPLLLLVLFAGLPNMALAHDSTRPFWTPGDPIVPCGMGENADQPVRCDKCQLLHLLRHLIDIVLIFVAPVLGTLFFIVAGVMIMLGGDNPGMLSRGKSMFKNTFIGVVIIFMAWLITNTLIQTLAKAGAVGEGNWWTFSCTPTLTGGQCVTDPFGTGSTGRFCNNTGQACVSDNDCR